MKNKSFILNVNLSRYYLRINNVANEIAFLPFVKQRCIFSIFRGQLEILCNPKQHVSQYPKLVLPEITDTRSKILKKHNIKTRYKATFSDQ